MKNNSLARYLQYAWPVFVALVLAGCKAGPQFQRPAAPEVSGYSAEPLKQPAGQTQEFIELSAFGKEGWQSLCNEELSALISEALERNPTLIAAEATLRQARELYSAKAGTTYYPKISADLGAQRQRFNPITMGQSSSPREFNILRAGLGAQYSFDLAGGNRRALEVLAARSDYEQYRLEGARLTLAADILATAMERAGLQRQLEVMENILQVQEEQLALTAERIRLGHVQPDEELSQQTRLEQTRAELPLLRNQIQQNGHLLAVLLGRAPAERPVPDFRLEDFTLPPQLPLLIPSELVHARPDILGAEALLHAANAEYGVAISRLYPQLTLSAGLATQALTPEELFGGFSIIWNLVGQITQPLFDPALPAEKRAALAAFDAAAANYQHVVLEALRNVADILKRVENDSDRLEAFAAADRAKGAWLETMERRQSLGAASYYELLLERQERLLSRMDLAQAQTQCLLNSVAFFQAMAIPLPEKEEADLTVGKN